jgi:hypothetical protein
MPKPIAARTEARKGAALAASSDQKSGKLRIKWARMRRFFASGGDSAIPPAMIPLSSMAPATVQVLEQGRAARAGSPPGRRRRRAAMAFAVAMLAAAPAKAAEVAISCTNPASGASWPIKIDYAKSTVDGYPAKISDVKISWHSMADGGNYTLDRKSGKLTVIVASSTGGYFLYDQCGLPN